MVLFSLLAVPLFTLFVVSSKASGTADVKRLWGHFLRGVLVFVPSYVILLLIQGAVPLHYSYGGIFAYYYFHEVLYYSVLAALSYLIIKHFSSGEERGSVSEAFVFFGGFFTLASIVSVIREFPYFNSYDLFLNPAMKLAVVSGLAFLLARATAIERWGGWIYLVIGLVFVTAVGFVPFLFAIHLAYVAIIVAVVLFVASLFPYVLMKL